MVFVVFQWYFRLPVVLASRSVRLHRHAYAPEPERPESPEVPFSYTAETTFALSALRENTGVKFPRLMPTLAASPVDIKEVDNPPQLPAWKGNLSLQLRWELWGGCTGACP